MGLILTILLLGTQAQQDWIEFTLVDGFPVTFSDNVRGIESLNNSVVMTDPVSDTLYVCSETGTLQNTVAINPGCSNAYGTCYGELGGEQCWFFNDSSLTSTTYLWRYTDPGTWTYCTNPAGGNGRGMDYSFLTGNYWQVAFDGDNSLWRHNNSGSYGFEYSISEVSGEISGVTAFPFDGDEGLVICGRTDNYFHVYKVLMGIVIHQGSALLPDTTVDYTLDISWNPTTDYFYWLYSKGGIRYVARLDATIEQDLQTETWGAVKSLFNQE